MTDLKKKIDKVLDEQRPEPLTDPEARLLELIMGKPAETPEEEIMVKEISALREAGYVIEIPGT